MERREHERIPIAVPVFVRGLDAEGREFLEFATALNISAGGALLATRRTLARFSKLSLEVPSAPMPRMSIFPKAIRRLSARLLRTSMIDGYQLWGVKFGSKLVGKGTPRRKVHSVR